MPSPDTERSLFMCFEYERLEALRRQQEKQEALKKAEEKARAPAKQKEPGKNTGQEQPVPA
jgi:hypothetical protein